MSLRNFLEFIANPFSYRQQQSETMVAILSTLLLQEERTKQMALNLEALTAEVTRVATVQDSAVTLLRALATELDKVAKELAEANDKLDDPIDTSGLDELAAKLKLSTDALAGAIADSDDVFEVPAPVEPAPEAPVVEEPVAEEPAPVVEEPVVETPAEEPVVEAPVEETPAEPVAEAPVEPAPEAPVDAAGVPGMDGTQSGEAVEGEPVATEEKPVE